MNKLNLLILLWESLLKNKQKQLKIKGKKQSDALDSLKPSDKQLPSIRDFISKERLNSEIVNEKERIGEEERKFERIKMVYKGSNETYDFRKLVMKLEIILLI